tara:strand:- start:7 stop:711 length:705 start_codon:yes stop_codon:yes gene_type:complete
MPHVPIFASSLFKGKSRNGVYGDVIKELDWSVGQIVKTLKDEKLRKKTIVVFTSDNGPWTMFKEFGGVSGRLRGEKSTTWEGGERVPCIVSWPEKIVPAVSNQLMANYDMFATFANLSGLIIPQGHAIDSIDFTPNWLKGVEGARIKHLYYFHQPMAYRKKNYKIHFHTRSRTRDPYTGKRETSAYHEEGLLYDLLNDISEKKNLAKVYPDRVKVMKEEFMEAQLAIKEWRPFQ